MKLLLATTLGLKEKLPFGCGHGEGVTCSDQWAASPVQEGCGGKAGSPQGRQAGT